MLLALICNQRNVYEGSSHNIRLASLQSAMTFIVCVVQRTKCINHSAQIALKFEY